MPSLSIVVETSFPHPEEQAPAPGQQPSPQETSSSKSENAPEGPQEAAPMEKVLSRFLFTRRIICFDPAQSELWFRRIWPWKIGG
jgi:hypothetical protein